MNDEQPSFYWDPRFILLLFLSLVTFGACVFFDLIFGYVIMPIHYIPELTSIFLFGFLLSGFKGDELRILILVLITYFSASLWGSIVTGDSFLFTLLFLFPFLIGYLIGSVWRELQNYSEEKVKI